MKTSPRHWPSTPMDAPATLSRSSECDDPAEPTELVIVETNGGTDGQLHHELPFALCPAEPVRTTALKRPINSSLKKSTAGSADPARSRLHRHPQPTAAANACRPNLPRSGDDIADITAALLDLEHSYLAVHGPPGMRQDLYRVRG